MNGEPPWDLFHEIAHGPSAKARRYVTDNGLEEAIRFRNVSFDEARRELQSRGGGGSLPALWDGISLYEGAESVVARLQTLVNLGRSP